MGSLTVLSTAEHGKSICSMFYCCSTTTAFNVPLVILHFNGV